MNVSTKPAWIKALLVTSAAAALATTLPAHAQETESKSASAREPEQTQSFFLKNVTWTSDINDVATDLRNALPRAKMYAVDSQNVITVHANADDMQQAQKLLAELDRPRKVYRVTFTINESDNGRKTGTQHYALTLTGDNKSWIKQGDRVPIVTGSFNKDTSNANTQIQYVDVGINIEVAIDGVGLRAKVEQTGIADEKSNVGIQDPIVRQTTVEATSTFTPGKPIALGSIDIPGTTRHQDIEAVAELVQ